MLSVSGQVRRSPSDRLVLYRAAAVQHVRAVLSVIITFDCIAGQITPHTRTTTKFTGG